MNDKPIPRRLFLKKAGAAGTAAATGLATSPPLAAQTVTARPGGRSADLILSNAKVITIDRDFTIAQAIAIAADRILAVGSNDTLAAHTTPETRVVDLKGRTVMPGIIDGHAHMDREGLITAAPMSRPARREARRIRDVAMAVVLNGAAHAQHEIRYCRGLQSTGVRSR
jgi:imidazolonepropionase-like amidohydrolase